MNILKVFGCQQTDLSSVGRAEDCSWFKSRQFSGARKLNDVSFYLLIYRNRTTLLLPFWERRSERRRTDGLSDDCSEEANLIVILFADWVSEEGGI
uniref:Uncharacterized protein n=1 Tax=Cucumis melo TaxID=3656 RepID=A0A9I9EAG2_CUCME